MDATATAALAQAASSLHASAREHKRAAAHHRQQARKLMRSYDELRAFCDQHGITLITGTDPEGTQP
jgi:hypothetical protein